MESNTETMQCNLDVASNHYKILGHVIFRNPDDGYIVSYKLFNNGDGSNITKVHLLKNNSKEYVMIGTEEIFESVFYIIRPLLFMDKDRYENNDIEIYLTTVDNKKLHWTNKNKNKINRRDRDTDKYALIVNELKKYTQNLYNNC